MKNKYEVIKVRINLLNINGSEKLVDQFRGKLYEKVYGLATKNTLPPISGFAVGCCEGALRITSRIATIAEGIFKGLLNILGSPFFHQCSVLRGIGQMVRSVVYIVAYLPFTCIAAVADIFVTTFEIASDPKVYTYSKWREHDPAEWNAAEDRSKSADKQKRIKRFKALCDRAKEDPEDTTVKEKIAQCYMSGRGVKQDRDIGVGYLTEAANSGSTKAMNSLVEHYTEEGTKSNFKKAGKWVRKGAKAEDPYLMFMYSLFLYRDNNVGIKIDESKAIKFMGKSLDHGYTPARGYLIFFLMRQNIQTNNIALEELKNGTDANTKKHFKEASKIEPNKKLMACYRKYYNIYLLTDSTVNIPFYKSDMLITVVDSFISAGNIDKAFEVANIIKNSLSRHTSTENIVGHLINKEDFDRLFEVFKKTDIISKGSVVYMKINEFLQKTNKFNLVVDFHRKVLEECAEKATYWCFKYRNFIKIALENSRYDDAIKMASKLPDNIYRKISMITILEALVKAGKYNYVVRLASKLPEDSNRKSLLITISEALKKAGKTDKAIEVDKLVNDDL